MSVTDDISLRRMVQESIREAIRGGGDLIAVLRSLGWDDVVADDPSVAYELLFTELGRAGAGHAALDGVVSTAVGLDAVVVYPRPSVDTCGHVDGDAPVAITGVALQQMGSGGAGILVPVSTDRGTSLCLISGAALHANPPAGWVPAGRLVDGTVSPAGIALGPSDPNWTEVQALARRCLAHELLGLADRMLAIASDHVRTREQFGRPIGSFQTVRHQVAEIHVGVTAGQQLAHDAWTSPDPGAAAVVAKAYAGRVHRTAARRAMQVCGAIGLTWEHGLHALVRRGFFLDALLGGERELGDALGEGLAAAPDGAWPALTAAETLLTGSDPCSDW